MPGWRIQCDCKTQDLSENLVEYIATWNTLMFMLFSISYTKYDLRWVLLAERAADQILSVEGIKFESDIFQLAMGVIYMDE